MQKYEDLSARLAQWLTLAAEVERIVDAIDVAATRAEDDAEYEALVDLHNVAGAALDGWTKVEQLFREMVVRHDYELGQSPADDDL
jgi:hypothetical protein